MATAWCVNTVYVQVEAKVKDGGLTVYVSSVNVP